MLLRVFLGTLGAGSLTGLALASVTSWGALDWGVLNWETAATSTAALTLGPGDVKGRKDAETYRFRGERSARVDMGGTDMDVSLERNLDNPRRVRFRVTSDSGEGCGAFKRWADARFKDRVDIDKSLTIGEAKLGFTQSQWTLGNTRVSLMCLSSKTVSAIAGQIERTSDAVELYKIPTVNCVSDSGASGMDVTMRIDDNSHKILRADNTEIDGSYVNEFSAVMNTPKKDGDDGSTFSINRRTGAYSLKTGKGINVDSGVCKKIDLEKRAF